MSFETPTSMNLPTIPEQEMEIVFIHASGPGGQSVNKKTTKVQLRWSVVESLAFSQEQKIRLREQLGKRVNSEGELIVECGETRSQSRNRDRAIEIARLLVAEALTPDAERIPTRPTRSSKERRLEEKSRQAQKKERRRREEW